MQLGVGQVPENFSLPLFALVPRNLVYETELRFAYLQMIALVCPSLITFVNALLPHGQFCPASVIAIQKITKNSPKKVAGAAGLEPVTSAVTGQRSNQLSYAPAWSTRT